MNFICLINNITDVYEEWPKDNYYLQEYVQNKYAEPDGVHHYETQEVLYNDQVYIEKGNEVNASFRAELPDGTIESEVNSIYPVSNFEYEDYENDKGEIPVGYINDIDLKSAPVKAGSIPIEFNIDNNIIKYN